ncbi:MAG: metallophosphoesterase [Armatimonadetes bacterium]|nr:metallophosphoesterase [Armatimonadota bacterium]
MVRSLLLPVLTGVLLVALGGSKNAGSAPSDATRIPSPAGWPGGSTPLSSLHGGGAFQKNERPLKGAANGIYPGLTREQEGRWTKPFFFIQLADSQFGMFGDDRSWEKETELLTRAVAHINRLRPRFVVVCGDLVNQPVGGPYYEAQVAEFQRIARQIDPSIPLVCLPGNHDVGGRPTPVTLADYRRRFGDDWFSFWVGGVCCLVLNSCLYSDPSGAPGEQERQAAWFARTLEAADQAGARHILVFQHHPWFLEKPDEPDGYFNIPRERREPALALMRRAGVRAIFAGHYHRNASGRDGQMEMVTTSAVGRPLGNDPSGLRIVAVYEDRIAHHYYSLDEVPEAVALE